jgi:hypothetical protein
MLKILHVKQRRLIDYLDQQMHNLYIYIYTHIKILTIFYLSYECEHFNLMILLSL